MADGRLESPSSVCVDDATLAAFVDGVLDPVARDRVVAHLASCADCSELVAEVIRTDEEFSESVGPAPIDRPVAVSPKPLLWKRRRLFAGVGGLGALAATVLLFVLNRGTALDPLVEIVGDERLTAARPTGGFQYGPLRSPLRGSSETDNLELRAEAARLRERAERTHAADDLHASGVALFLAGGSDAGVLTLEAALRDRPNDPVLLSDLGAAYMTRFVDRGDQADAVRALAAIDKALSIAPATKEAWFNKGLLLERMKRPSDALKAWTQYLELPAEAGWRDEAIRNRDAVQRQLSGQ